MVADSRKTVYCWAMGIVQHRNGVANVKEISNLAFLQGNIGKPGAGLFPVRGHSNVQGDRTMGIWERPPEHFLDALRDEFGFEPPREHGLDAVGAVKAFRDGKAKVFFGLGGNFVAAMSDTNVTEDALRRAELTVQVSTKPNRSHVVHGREALILPSAGPQRERTSPAAAPAGHGRGLRLRGARLARPARAGLAAPALGGRHHRVDGDRHAGRPPRHPVGGLPRRLPPAAPPHRPDGAGLRGYEEKVDQPGGFVLPHPPAARHPHLRDRGRQGGVHRQPHRRAPGARGPACCCRRCARTTSSTPSSTALTTATRGIKDGRQVVLLNPRDIEAQGLHDGQHVDITSEWEDGSTRTVERFRVVPYDTPVGCAAAYYPETNALARWTSKAEGSNQPAYKSIVVRLEPSAVDAPTQGRPVATTRDESPDEHTPALRGADAPELSRAARPAPSGGGGEDGSRGLIRRHTSAPTTPTAAITTQAAVNASWAAAYPTGVPSTATRTETPSTVPIWRLMFITALPVAVAAGGGRRSRRQDRREGEPDAGAHQQLPGEHLAHPVRVGPDRDEDGRVARRHEQAPEGRDASDRTPRRAIRVAAYAVSCTVSGPGAMARPARTEPYPTPAGTTGWSRAAPRRTRR